MVAAEQEAPAAIGAERVLRDKLEHVLFADTVKASPQSPYIVNVQAAVDVGVQSFRPLVRVPGKPRDGLTDTKADARIQRRGLQGGLRKRVPGSFRREPGSVVAWSAGGGNPTRQ